MQLIPNKKIRGWVLVGLTLFSIISSISQISPVSARVNLPELQILILTNREDGTKSAPFVSLNLDNKLKNNLDVFTISDDVSGAIQSKNISDYDVVIIDSYLPANLSDTTWLYNQIISNEVGLLFFGGNYTEVNLGIFGDVIPAYFTIDRDSINRTFDGAYFGPLGYEANSGLMSEYMDIIYDQTKPLQILTDQIQVSVSEEETQRENEGSGSIFSKNIAWQSCPLLRERVFTFARKPNTFTLVEVPNTQEPLVVMGKVSDYSSHASDASVMFISTGVGLIEQYEDGEYTGLDKMNEPFTLWPYFNYFMYTIVYTLASKLSDKSLIEDYATWPWSPIPHATEATIWMIFVASLWIFNFWLFFTLGRKKKGKVKDIVAPSPSTPSQSPPSEDQKSSTSTTTDSPSRKNP